MLEESANWLREDRPRSTVDHVDGGLGGLGGSEHHGGVPIGHQGYFAATPDPPEPPGVRSRSTLVGIQQEGVVARSRQAG
jgi:hypothetical protein